MRMVNRYTAWLVVQKFGYIRMVNRYTAWLVVQKLMNNSEYLMLDKNDISDFEFRLSDLKKNVPLNLFQGLNFFNQKNQKNQRNQKNEKNQNTISDFGLRKTPPYNEQRYIIVD